MSTDANGNVTVNQGYYAYGRYLSGGTLPTDRRYTGQQRDDTGLYYYNARYYDPLLGTFISPDTLVPDPGNVQSYNRYLYALGNPIKYNDPTGHSCDTNEGFVSPLHDDGTCSGGEIGELGEAAGETAAAESITAVEGQAAVGPVRLQEEIEANASLAQYSNVGSVQKPLFKELSANAGNTIASRLDEIPAYGYTWNGKLASAGKADTLGILEVPGQSDVYLQSQYDGPSDLMPQGTPGLHGNIKSHVEAHAASIMRLENIKEATLYLNHTPCDGPIGCERMLPRMLPPGARLTIVAPGYEHPPFIGITPK